MGTLLGFDYGPRKIGVAVGQTVTNTATPLQTLRALHDQPDWSGIARLIKTWQPEALVVGLPFDLDDSEAQLAPEARRFARRLHGRFRLPVHLADERLTSREARQQAGGHIRNIEELDAIAAKLILETWLHDR
jgi:putative Holliday junction resolvase